METVQFSLSAYDIVYIAIVIGILCFGIYVLIQNYRQTIKEYQSDLRNLDRGSNELSKMVGVPNFYHLGAYHVFFALSEFKDLRIKLIDSLSTNTKLRDRIKIVDDTNKKLRKDITALEAVNKRQSDDLRKHIKFVSTTENN